MWLANVVLVKKLSGEWRICVDYIDLNKACPKDLYPLPNINHLVDGALSFGMLSFKGAFFGHNQVKTHLDNEDKLHLSSMRGYTTIE